MRDWEIRLLEQRTCSVSVIDARREHPGTVNDGRKNTFTGGAVGQCAGL
jgi:hypothetical protein